MKKYLDNEGLSHFWTSLKALLGNKVDKVSGKGLSTNDYTTTEKNKLAGIASNAQVNVIETVKVNGTALTPSSKVVNITLTGLGGIPSSEKGASSGVATLGSDGKVPSSQLPSYVDDVLEYNSSSAFPSTGESGKIYVAKDTNKTYRWSGTAYVEISASIALGETSSTAYAGDKGKANADAIATHTGNADIHVTTANKTTWNGKYSKPSGGIPKSDLASAVQTSLGKADTALQEHQSLADYAKTADVNTSLATKVDKSSLGVPSGVATLGTDGYLKTSQLPPSVDLTRITEEEIDEILNS